LLVPILRDPASYRETCDHAHLLLSRCAAMLAPEQYAGATHGTHAIHLPAVLGALEYASKSAAMPPAAEAGIASLPAPRPHVPPMAQSAQPPIEPLTERELAVLQLIAEGQSNQQIAAHLVIAPGTAKWHISQIFGKLGVHSRTQAIVRAREFGYLV
jgi:DNA-binding NarL/FixJ family response regulator